MTDNTDDTTGVTATVTGADQLDDVEERSEQTIDKAVGEQRNPDERREGSERSDGADDIDPEHVSAEADRYINDAEGQTRSDRIKQAYAEYSKQHRSIEQQIQQAKQQRANVIEEREGFASTRDIVQESLGADNEDDTPPLFRVHTGGIIVGVVTDEQRTQTIERLEDQRDELAEQRDQLDDRLDQLRAARRTAAAVVDELEERYTQAARESLQSHQ